MRMTDLSLLKMLNVSIPPSLVRRVSRSKKSSFEEADMARQAAASQSSKSIAGAALVGLGLFILYENVAAAIAYLRDVLGSNGSEALGIFPAVILATSKAVQACAFEQQRIVPCLLRMLISFWPPLLVIVGTMLLRNGFTDKVKASPAPNQYLKKTFQK